MDRRTLLAAAAAALAGSRLSVSAQEATPSSGGLGSLVLPELSVKVTDTAYEGIPEEVTAGRYLLRTDLPVDTDEAVGFLKLPDGMDVPGFLDVLQQESEGPPDWYYTTEHAGGVSGPGPAVINLTPGAWLVWGDNPGAMTPPFGFTVTGEAVATPEPSSDIPADVTIEMSEYAFKIDGTLRPGHQTIAVINVGAQPHFIIGLATPERVSGEQIMRLLELDMSGATPEAGEDLPDPEAFRPALYVPTLSSGRSEWLEVDLQAGWHALFCFVPDLETGEPHAMKGMYEIVEIGGSATPTS